MLRPCLGKCHHEPLGETEASSTPPGLWAGTIALRLGKASPRLGTDTKGDTQVSSSSFSLSSHTVSCSAGRWVEKPIFPLKACPVIQHGPSQHVAPEQSVQASKGDTASPDGKVRVVLRRACGSRLGQQ